MNQSKYLAYDLGRLSAQNGLQYRNPFRHGAAAGERPQYYEAFRLGWERGAKELNTGIFFLRQDHSIAPRGVESLLQTAAYSMGVTAALEADGKLARNPFAGEYDSCNLKAWERGWLAGMQEKPASRKKRDSK